LTAAERIIGSGSVSLVNGILTIDGTSGNDSYYITTGIGGKLDVRENKAQAFTKCVL
jgi:hypothetical protein